MKTNCIVSSESNQSNYQEEGCCFIRIVFIYDTIFKFSDLFKFGVGAQINLQPVPGVKQGQS